MSQGYPPQLPFGQQPNSNNPQYPDQLEQFPQLPQQKKRKSIKEQWNSGPAGKCGVIAIVIIALLICGACSGIANAVSRGSQDTASQPTQTTAQVALTDVPTNTLVPTDTPTPSPTPAYQLATIDTGTIPDDVTVAKYQKLLDVLHDKTGEPEQNIADETVNGQQILQKNGMNATLFDLMNGVNIAVTKPEHIKYTEALAALITIMENQ